jgi:hypothetical protein
MKSFCLKAMLLMGLLGWLNPLSIHADEPQILDVDPTVTQAVQTQGVFRITDGVVDLDPIEMVSRRTSRRAANCVCGKPGCLGGCSLDGSANGMTGAAPYTAGTDGYAGSDNGDCDNCRRHGRNGGNAHNGYGNGNCPPYGNGCPRHGQLGSRWCDRCDNFGNRCRPGCDSLHCWLHGKFGYFCPTGGCGKGLPPFGHYSMVYAVDPQYSDARDSQLYAAEGYGVPISVPLAPNVHHQYNYSWGTPASRLTPISNP